MSPTVHVLLYGRVLCGNLHGLPKDWGPGHRWVRVEERSDATCARCKRAADAVAAAVYGAPRHEVMRPPAGVDDGEVE